MKRSGTKNDLDCFEDIHLGRGRNTDLGRIFNGEVDGAIYS